MTEQEKIKKLDEELRPKHPDMTQEEYEAFRSKYIRRKNSQILRRVLFSTFIFPILVYFLFDIIFDPPLGLLMILVFSCFTIAFFKGKEASNELPIANAGTLTLKRMTKGLWKYGKYTLECNRVTNKDYSSGDVDTGDSYRLWFNQYPYREGYSYSASEQEYFDAQIGDLYYLVLKKKHSGKIKVVRAFKAELNPLDAQLSDILKQEGDTYNIK